VKERQTALAKACKGAIRNHSNMSALGPFSPPGFRTLDDSPSHTAKWRSTEAAWKRRVPTMKLLQETKTPERIGEVIGNAIALFVFVALILTVLHTIFQK
jgi:hypothetical protein